MCHLMLYVQVKLFDAITIFKDEEPRMDANKSRAIRVDSRPFAVENLLTEVNNLLANFEVFAAVGTSASGFSSSRRDFSVNTMQIGCKK